MEADRRSENLPNRYCETVQHKQTDKSRGVNSEDPALDRSRENFRPA
jgi:hypothetical protein